MSNLSKIPGVERGLEIVKYFDSLDKVEFKKSLGRVVDAIYELGLCVKPLQPSLVNYQQAVLDEIGLSAFSEKLFRWADEMKRDQWLYQD